jgi:hypothetical protein
MIVVLSLSIQLSRFCRIAVAPGRRLRTGTPPAWGQLAPNAQVLG